MSELRSSRLDLENPWPGLDAFSEADRAYFHGRDSETEDLLARVRSETLTVLYARSGIGKTSVLNAGLFPQLREEDLLPVYVRFVHGAETTLREQVFMALAVECAEHGVEASPSRDDETLWEYFHRAGTEFWNARNRPVVPVLVFDQFEEMFTLGGADRETQAQTAALLEELGEIIENRAPEHVKDALEADASGELHFDFRARNVKVLLSFREDFLADVDGLRQGIPSLVHNRFRLSPLTGHQALDAVTRAGHRVVDPDVALRIIGLAGRGSPEAPTAAELLRLEVDPALLSVLCSELNLKRQRAQLPKITPELLLGAEREILDEFYERGLAGLDPRVRVFIEEKLLTAGGFRNSYARDDALAEPGLSEEALAALVSKRLVREDERFGARRLELTHDILIPVVLASRDTRRAREAEAAAIAGRVEHRQRRRASMFLIGFPAAVVSIVAIAAVALWLVFESFTEMTSATRQRWVTLETTSEFSQLVDRMGRLVIAFVVTGDTRYLQEYYALTDYRTVMGGSGLREFLKESAGGKGGQTFEERLREVGASGDELGLLEHALATSDALHKQQQIAFAAMQGLYDPARGQFVTGGEPHPEFALKTLFGREYEDLTRTLHVDVQRLSDMVDARTAKTVQKETEELSMAILVAGGGLIVLIVLTVAALVVIGGYRRPLRRASDFAGNARTKALNVQGLINEQSGFLVRVGST